MGRPGAFPDGRLRRAGRGKLRGHRGTPAARLTRAALAATLCAAPPLAAQDPAPSPDSVVAIEPVTVEVGRLRAGSVPLARTPFSAQVVGAGELTRGAGSALSDAISGLPGVTVTNQTGSGAQADIRLRGFAVSPIVGVPQSVSVFVDGVRVNEADASQVHLSLIPAGAVERIELIRGPVGVFGKNSIAGALNFVTRRAEGPPTLMIESEYGSFGTRSAVATASGVVGSFDGLLLASTRRSDGWRALDEARELSLFSKVGWRGGRTDAWLSYTFEADSLEGPGPLPESWLLGGPLPPDIDPAPDDRRRLQYTGGRGDAFTPRLHFLNSRVERELSDTWSLTVNASARLADFRQTNDNLTEPDALGRTDIHSYGSTVQTRYQPDDRLIVAGGAEWTRNDVDIRIYERPNARFPSVVEAVTEHLRTDEDNLGGFGEVWWELSPGLAAYGSLRFDHVDLPVRDLLDPADSGDNSFSELSGGLGLSKDLAGGLNAFAGYGRGFRAPVILEVTCADPDDPCQLPFELGPDPPLDPVRSDTWQAGLRLARGATRATAVGYWIEVRDDIFNVVDEDTPTRGYFTNVDRTRRTGLELSLATRPLPMLEGLTLTSSLGWTRATFQSEAELASPLVDDDPADPGNPSPPDDDAGTLVGPGDRFPMVPEVSAMLGLSYRAGLLAVHVEGSWTGPQFLVGDEGNEEAFPKLDATRVLDLRIEYGEADGPALYLEVANVLDEEYAAFGIISENGRATPEQAERFLTPGTPRRLTVGFRYAMVLFGD